MKNNLFISILVISQFLFCIPASEQKNPGMEKNQKGQNVYTDTPFLQDYSIKFFFPEGLNEKIMLYQVAADRNRNIQIISSAGLLLPYNGHFLTPGELLPDRTYRYMQDRKISSVISYQNQFVYTDDNLLFSNAWAGSLAVEHNLGKAVFFAGGADFDFMVSDGTKLAYFTKEGKQMWNGSLSGIISISHNPQKNNFLVVTGTSVSLFDPKTGNLTTAANGKEITCAASAHAGQKIVVGTKNGYFWLDDSGKPEGEMIKKVPCAEITRVVEISGTLWFGSTGGAFRLNDQGKYDYYASQRWLPDNHVRDIAAGPDGSVLVLTETGLGQICYQKMTLEEKALQLEDQTRRYHIRYGFSCTAQGMVKGNMGQRMLADSDNDGLWTSMYLGAELFRYATTKDPEAWENCKESLMGFERLYSITGVPGLPARAYEVIGYQSSGYTNAFSESTRHLFEKSGYDVTTSPWRNGTDKGWVWKSTTSSDEVLGHYFALSLFADLADDPSWKERARKLVVELSEHLYRNNLYLCDWDGKPTTWGKWNPEYVNGFPTMVGDRKLTSSNVIGFLQSAYHFTKDEKYKEKILELLGKEGYLENLMRPMKQIGKVEGKEKGKIETWSEMLSSDWNHSDDEMYFLGYWALFRYALNDDLKQKYVESIRDHWSVERPEKDPVWDFTYALTGAKDFDLLSSVGWLQRHPMDMISWRIENDQRGDIEKIPANFRNQLTREVLSPAEGVIHKHAGNRFALNRNGNGSSAETPGDVWLLPYWMGRYLGIISAPVTK